jgi:prephenate dehydrogenase
MTATQKNSSGDAPLTLGIIGVGLIGASIGLAQKKAKAFDRVLGVGRSQSNLDQALKMGAIDQVVSLE